MAASFQSSLEALRPDNTTLERDKNQVSMPRDTLLQLIAVAANKNGTIIQVCNKADQVCYFSGKYNQDGSVDWLHTGKLNDLTNAYK